MKSIRFSFVLPALLCLGAGSIAHSEGTHPSLIGRWELDPGNSSLGNMPKMEKYVEVIEEDYPRIVITTTEKAPGQPQHTVKIQYYADGREAATEIGGVEYKSKSIWRGDKLITLITPPKGDQMIEQRYLSKDRKSQAVDIFFKVVGSKPDQERIMQYRGPK